jgi:hypothetical protein
MRWRTGKLKDRQLWFCAEAHSRKMPFHTDAAIRVDPSVVDTIEPRGIFALRLRLRDYLASLSGIAR